MIKAGVAYVEVAYDPASIAALRATTAKEGARAAQSFGQSFTKAGARLTSVGHSLNRNVTLPIGIAAAASVKFAVDFQRSMELVHTQAGASQAEVVKMSKAILDLAPSVATGPNELAKALFHLESVGLRGAKALDALKTAALGAKVGQADLEATTNALAAAQVVQIKGTANVSHTMATLNAIVGVGNMRMNDLASAMGSGILPVAKNFGLSLRDVGAALATMTDAGVPAVDAATRLRMSFALMAAPTTKAATLLGTIHLSSTALADAMRKPDGLVGAITLLRDHLSGLSKTQQAALLTGAFGGGRSSATIITLVNNLDRLGKKYNDIGKGISKYGDAVKKTTETDQFKFEQSLAQLQSTGIKIGADLLPVLVTLAGDVGGVAKAFSGLSPTMQHVIIDSALVLAALGPISVAAGTVGKVVGLMATAYTALVPAQAAAALSSEGFAASTVASTAALGGMGGAIVLAALAIGGIAFAMYKLGGSTSALSGPFQAASAAVDALKRSLDNERDSIFSLIHGNLDLRQNRLDLTKAEAANQANKAKQIATQSLVNRLVAEGKTGTKAYTAAVKANTLANQDYNQGQITLGQLQVSRFELSAKQVKNLADEKTATEKATKTVSGYADKFSKLATQAGLAETGLGRVGRQLHGTTVATDRGAHVLADYVKGTKDLSDKITKGLPKLEAERLKADALAASFKGSHSEAAQAARAYAANADAAVIAAKKLGRLEGIASLLSQAWQRIVDLPTAQFFIKATTQLTTIETNRTNRFKSPTTKPAKAAGGPVWGGSTYMVGEKGPELFTAPANGQIIPNDKLGMSQPVIQVFLGTEELDQRMYRVVETKQRKTAQTVRAGRRWSQ